ncbi:hypothetical protein [Paraburkholderia sp. Tr-20389]|uniref:hypothetical protein n=1 Tax=Paraburkholderia sp. Tr-20389 TaxID=2703903 RepID=UPI001F119E2D|nr:hypothetical protein [Paraburkholderia sp. Tr-20389]
MRQSTELLDDPVRCIHIGDWESDIYALFCTAYDLSTYFLVRTCVDRLAGEGQHTISKAMWQVQVKGLHRVELRDAKGRPMTATLELRYAPMTVLPPIGKQSRYPADCCEPESSPCVQTRTLRTLRTRSGRLACAPTAVMLLHHAVPDI